MAVGRGRVLRLATLIVVVQASATHEVDAVLDSFLRRITPVRAEVVRLYLYGSRSRGDHRPDSDYDVFVVLRERARPTVDALYDAVVDVVCETGSLISLKIVFVANVLHDGVPLALDYADADTARLAVEEAQSIIAEATSYLERVSGS